VSPLKSAELSEEHFGYIFRVKFAEHDTKMKAGGKEFAYRLLSRWFLARLA
jgi:hypothetical protein